MTNLHIFKLTGVGDQCTFGFTCWVKALTGQRISCSLFLRMAPLPAWTFQCVFINSWQLGTHWVWSPDLKNLSYTWRRDHRGRSVLQPWTPVQVPLQDVQFGASIWLLLPVISVCWTLSLCSYLPGDPCSHALLWPHRICCLLHCILLHWHHGRQWDRTTASYLTIGFVWLFNLWHHFSF